MKQTTIPTIVLLLASFTVLRAADPTPASPQAAKEDRRPNIVFIMADDLGYTDVACFGSKYYETPNIDRLATQGMKLTSHHHCQNCTPTRAALMSGQHGARTGVYTVGGIERHKDEPFFLYLPHFGVHAPHDAKPELFKRFQDKPGVGGHANPIYAAMARLRAPTP